MSRANLIGRKERQISQNTGSPGKYLATLYDASSYVSHTLTAQLSSMCQPHIVSVIMTVERLNVYKKVIVKFWYL